MVNLSLRKKEYQHHALLFTAAYSFLLRVPSEALPMIEGKHDNIPDGQAVAYMKDGALFLKLRRRKNKPGGSTLIRHCTCKAVVLSLHSCSVHMSGVIEGK